MSAGSNLQGGGGLTLEQRVANLEAALRGGPPVIDAQGANTDGTTDLGGPMNAWRRVYAQLISLGGEDFNPQALSRNIRGMRAEYDYVWNGVHPDDLDQNAVIWLDGTTPGDHDIAALVNNDDVVEFRLLLLTTGRDSGNRRISGTNAQRFLPATDGSGVTNSDPGYIQVNDANEFYGSWQEFQTSARGSWHTPIRTSNADFVTYPSSHWRRLTRTAGQSMVVHLGEESQRGSNSNTQTTITIGGTTVWDIIRNAGSGTNLSSAVAGPINGACLLVPIYPV